MPALDFVTVQVEVQAMQLTWENWQEFTEWAIGQFHQTAQIRLSTDQHTTAAYCNVRGVGRVNMGDWLVDFGGARQVFTMEEFAHHFEPPRKIFVQHEGSALPIEKPKLILGREL